MSKKILAFEQPEDHAGYLLWQVSMQWQLKMNRALEIEGITFTQFVVMAALHWLSQSQKIVVQVEIANHANIDKMMLSKILRHLEKEGMVKRTASETDTRAKEIEMTKKGIELFKKANKIVEKIDQKFFSKMEEKEEKLIKLMKRLIN
jgi:DNA-binding MarR family transcriptional regulator